MATVFFTPPRQRFTATLEAAFAPNRRGAATCPTASATCAPRSAVEQAGGTVDGGGRRQAVSANLPPAVALRFG